MIKQSNVDKFFKYAIICNYIGCVFCLSGFCSLVNDYVISAVVCFIITVCWWWLFVYIMNLVDKEYMKMREMKEEVVRQREIAVLNDKIKN